MQKNSENLTKQENRPKSTFAVALAGSPNVGKSTVFNNLTGLRRHTGNWCGKTVDIGAGDYVFDGDKYTLLDLPGTYSLYSHSAEEQVARDFVCFEEHDAVVIVCDGSSLSRSLGLVLQILERRDRAVLCVNLLDEAERKHVKVNTQRLATLLGIPVVGTVAHNKKSLEKLKDALSKVCNGQKTKPVVPIYDDETEKAVVEIYETLSPLGMGEKYTRWAALRLLEGGDDELTNRIISELSRGDEQVKENVVSVVNTVRWSLMENGISAEMVRDRIAGMLATKAEEICRECLEHTAYEKEPLDRRIDKILTGKFFAFPAMLALLALVFWITITGANYPSEFLSNLFTSLEAPLHNALLAMHIPQSISSLLVFGMYRVLSWVVAVMLPPMAIFFPLFTLLEDSGYLPRIAFNLDKPFKRCKACGKQALTMCMGFGCNAVGVTGCRIIDSPRERLLAIITNSFVPCNGRFPTIIALLSMFFVGTVFSGALETLLLTLVIVVGIVLTLVVTRLLSETLLRGQPSSFTLELPSYRKPQISKVIVRSVLDRTLFVLARAVSVAAPAGIVIYLLSNIHISGASCLAHISSFLDPFGRFLGLDGVILLAFILGFPANEIVVPIILMSYMASGTLVPVGELSQLKALLVANGWTQLTAVCTILFSLVHWPCSTTLITVYKETKSVKWTLASFAVPTVTGIVLCALVNFIGRLFL